MPWFFYNLKFTILLTLGIFTSVNFCRHSLKKTFHKLASQPANTTVSLTINRALTNNTKPWIHCFTIFHWFSNLSFDPALIWKQGSLGLVWEILTRSLTFYSSRVRSAVLNTCARKRADAKHGLTLWQAAAQGTASYLYSMFYIYQRTTLTFWHAASYFTCLTCNKHRKTAWDEFI